MSCFSFYERETAQALSINHRYFTVYHVVATETVGVSQQYDIINRFSTKCNNVPGRFVCCVVMCHLSWTDGRLAHQSVGFDVWNATWSSSSTRPPPAGLSLVAAAVYWGPTVVTEGPVTCAAPTWRHSSAAGQGSGVGTQDLQVPPPHPGAVGSSIGGAGHTRNRPGCCLDPECPGLKKKKNIC